MIIRNIPPEIRTAPKNLIFPPPLFLLRLREGGEGLGAGTESVDLFADLKTTPNPDYFFFSQGRLNTEHFQGCNTVLLAHNE